MGWVALCHRLGFEGDDGDMVNFGWAEINCWHILKQHGQWMGWVALCHRLGFEGDDGDMVNLASNTVELLSAVTNINVMIVSGGESIIVLLFPLKFWFLITV
jgi:hypothetical protein